MAIFCEKETMLTVGLNKAANDWPCFKVIVDLKAFQENGVYTCSWKHYFKKSKQPKFPSFEDQRHDIDVHWNILQPWQWTKAQHMSQHGWLQYIKGGRYKSPSIWRVHTKKVNTFRMVTCKVWEGNNGRDITIWCLLEWREQLEVNSRNDGGCFNMVKMMSSGLSELRHNFLFLPFKIIRCFASG